MIERTIGIINKLGLHARAAAKLVQTSAGFTSEITVARDGKQVNAKSIMGVMMLAAARGSAVTIRADGPDEENAIIALTDLINGKFGEPE
ncbi:MAG: HPr family phosphocarrier protein [Gammaproteobacteria bacterium]|nr:HPr family phosphocarrier protein [Gammaproteobacteria bacterium]